MSDPVSALVAPASGNAGHQPSGFQRPSTSRAPTDPDRRMVVEPLQRDARLHQLLEGTGDRVLEVTLVEPGSAMDHGVSREGAPTGWWTTRLPSRDVADRTLSQTP